MIVKSLLIRRRVCQEHKHANKLTCTTTRSFAVYAVGDGWTGALGQKYAHSAIAGHNDEEDADTPVLIYPHKVDQAAIGWGSTAILKDGKLYMVGRPHDLVNLLRLYRLPKFIRQWSAATIDSSDTTYVGKMISNAIGWATGMTEQEWTGAQEQSRLQDWTLVEVPSTESSLTHVQVSAGFTAVLGASGTLYTFGINSRAQCGIGKVSNNVWTPEPVLGLTTQKQKEQDSQSSLVEQEEPIIQVALGLQHAYALSSKSGHLYSWGKAGRGQLGREIGSDQASTAKPLMSGVVLVSSGMHHGACLTHDNQVYMWGRNMAVSDDDDDNNNNGKAQDVRLPVKVEGFPTGKQVVQLSCGSHHTSVLLEDGSVYAFGIAADINVPIMEPVQLVPPGVLEMPLRQFESHHDRTTVIDKGGHVYQVHLWKDEGLQEFSMFTPAWVDTLLDKQQSIISVHRGWLHTIIVTEDKK
jgi:alpha-tubulin suppressor-like RCC1 family protein